MVQDQKGRVIGTSVSEVIADTSGNLPAAGTSGRIFFETDTGRTLYDNGSSWVEVGLSESEINHDSIQGVVANEHIDHSTVSVSAGTHLTGGGDLTASRTLNVDATTINLSDLNADYVDFNNRTTDPALAAGITWFRSDQEILKFSPDGLTTQQIGWTI